MPARSQIILSFQELEEIFINWTFQSFHRRVTHNLQIGPSMCYAQWFLLASSLAMVEMCFLFVVGSSLKVERKKQLLSYC